MTTIQMWGTAQCSTAQDTKEPQHSTCISRCGKFVIYHTRARDFLHSIEDGINKRIDILEQLPEKQMTINLSKTKNGRVALENIFGVLLLLGDLSG